MENAYKAQKDHHYIRIISSEIDGCESGEVLQRTAVFVSLYYYEQLDFYEKYIVNIPLSVDLYIISSEEALLERLKKDLKRDAYYLRKNNRGRDISALLVVCKEYIDRYQYFCFIHDKKSEDRDWVENLWGNTLGIGDAHFIGKIIALFEQNNEIGLVIPPELISADYKAFGRFWAGNYDNTVKLARELHLDCEIKKEIEPISLGTIFWCRTKAIRKLFEKKWEYTDFQEEPLPEDGTISHAVERIIPYVVQSAGYATVTVMNDRYAEHAYDVLYESLVKSMDICLSELGISSLHEVSSFGERRDRMLSFSRKYRNLFLYGSGVVGERCLKFLRHLNINISGFTETTPKTDESHGLPLMAIDRVAGLESAGVIVSVGKKYKDEINGILDNMNIPYMDYQD